MGLTLDVSLTLKVPMVTNINFLLTISAVARPNGQLRQAGVARGVRGHALPPREILNFSLSEMRFAAFSAFSVLIRRKFWLYIYIF